MRRIPLSDWDLLTRVLGFEGARTVYIYGRPGVGKTYGAYHFGRIQNGFYAVTLTDETSAAELRGHFIFKGGDALFHDGPFVRAMREGKRLVINEIGNASADVLALLFPVLESLETAELTLPTGETIRPAPGFHVIATDNRPPDLLPDALQDRFMCQLRVDEPHPDALARLRPEFRKAAESALAIKDDRRPGARSWQNLEILEREFGLVDACRLVFGPDRGQMVFDALQMAEAKRSAPRRPRSK